MRVLGVETSCDETAAAVVEDGRRILAQTVASQVTTHAQFGGVVPEVASRQHVRDITRVVERTLEDAGLTWDHLDGIAVTCGPGLLGALLVGISAAKGYALATGLPLVGVHHIAGHVAAAFLDADEATASTEGDPGPATAARPHGGLLEPPVLALVVSGGHTEILDVDEAFHFRRLGGTKDDAAGEAYDKVARMVGLSYPGGPKVDELAGQGDPQAFSFPRAMLEEGLDFSFSGLKSAVAGEVERQRRSGGLRVADVCASFQQAVVDVLVEKAARAMRETGRRTLVVAGGVAANRGLRAALAARAAADGFEVRFPPVRLCTDNAAMIAAAGCVLLARGRCDPLTLNAHAQLSLDAWQSGRV
ncbi:tRNA (adenosine(37)-N6)-threonylcarbamoyltransferase complex transferase subunit TsaD [Alicyclobacillus sp.]|uniref:tRNA (adenosine(37)-N6)-threonylcarbamoyltransferase complex transferase subunit TsaD n=1 Tax=Alicyclobacillus sp. TaxID=61169 RepID=UPI0025C28119|nr:tRNA (adenosine(37)-N6)-threonylcarbamoyltransferase complex transferase subunit TsaD [Alicyclobacillus sp.]MCL6517491.1 tRNA (adenosine(37)-N6)-threonylcarbamoyltransferase complex transferase subunit TsaD [Alicyclobacillus sp.]